MTTRPVEAATRNGILGTYYAATALDSVPPGSLLHIKNGSGVSVTPTWITPGVVDTDVAIGDPAGTAIAAGAAAFLRTPTDRNYVDPADGLVDIAIAPFASVTFAVIG